jgi:steroid 5-alpha reductase family enzyme
MNSTDTMFSRVLMVLILIEFFADQQQWSKLIPLPRFNVVLTACILIQRILDFQQAKKEYNRTAKPPPKYSREELDRGFITSGLWAWSRHPNFAAEQAIWVCLYQWCCFETFVYMNWTFAGALGYLLLFQASTWFTELISAGKYPGYKDYQSRVGKFLPKLWSAGVDAENNEKRKMTAARPVKI